MPPFDGLLVPVAAGPVYHIFMQESGSPSMNTSRLSIAVQELEQALAALDETMQTTAQKLQGRQDSPVESVPQANGDPVQSEQVKEELMAVRRMVSDAAGLIALARAADTQPEQPQ